MPPDVWPTFWSRISELIRDGKIFSSVKVKEEIEHGNDELTLWMANNATNNFYYEIDSDILQNILQLKIGHKRIQYIPL